MTNKKRHIAILGSTGSIGTQTLDVVRNYPDFFKIQVLTANNNDDLLIKQAIEFNPNAVVIVNETKYDKVFEALDPKGIKVFAGQEPLTQVVEFDAVDIVLTALVGYVGLKPILKAIKAGKTIALANKETLVVAGELIIGLAKKMQIKILPVDSEHSAIFQCLVGEEHNPIQKIFLTASGGPFRGKNLDYLKTVTKEQALKHPNWNMGAKITIDSATLMNKGFEVIEAKWLFGIETSQIEVIIHPQSIIHSIVEFKDGSMKAQMGLPDMRIPIQYALSFPQRLESDLPKFNFADHSTLTFEKPDLKTFKNLGLAYMALNKGGNMPCILNAANEIAVSAFLEEKLGFLEISDIIEGCMHKISFIATPSLEDYVETDSETRNKALELVNL